MKKNICRMIATILIFSGVTSLSAQKLVTVDTEGNPVAYAHVFDENGSIIGTTGMAGEIEGFKGDQTITITHVAFKTKKVYVKGQGDVRVPLEDSDYSLDEIVVKPKDYVYVQTYYRLIYMWDDTLQYCRFGVADNVYDIKKKSVSSNTAHISKAEMGLLKTTLDGLLGRIIDGMGDLPKKKNASNTDLTDSKLKLKAAGEGRQNIYYGDQVVGNVVDDTKDRLHRITLDEGACRRISKKEKQDAKAAKLEKKGKTPKEKEEYKKNEQNNIYRVYQLGEDGKCGTTDFLMSQWHDDYDTYMKSEKKDVHVRLWLESYAIEREYVTKEELKEKKKANKVSLSYSFLQDFERQHNIPALPTKAQEGLQKLFTK
ncbi:MAG: hypothetical protein IJV33_11340 [Bacteroidaceae bacterium]|nr:hypothetical protein [Bacteroidaceae bacterium]